MTELPAGTVTFLFTDIEGSTRLWEQHPDAMRLALARHDALAANVIVRHGGFLVKSRGEGDSLFAVFPRATDAVAAACALQRALIAEPGPLTTPLRVRVAVHTGEAELRESDYYGAAVSRCARLRAIAHGAQVLLSLPTEELVRDALPQGVSLRDLGSHRLKDLQRPEQVFQLLHPALHAEFPALQTLDMLPNNLPQQLTSFIGREHESAQVKQFLGTTRFLTLTGAGGTGKTRLALQTAADVLEEYANGVWWVELAALADPVLVPQAVASVLDVHEEPGRSLTDTLADVLKPRTLLLVLDNCEHMLPACATLAEMLLRACPHLRILASSREALGVGGERTYRVPSLSQPDLRQLPPGGADLVFALTQYEAVRLFIERAVFAHPEFAVTNQNAPAVAQVCSRLDGIPLAIELAAARVKALPVEQIAKRLDDRFRLLTGGSRTALPRQQTLRALIDWSYDLLSEAERTLLGRLSVFAGGWTLEAAEAVCADGDEEIATPEPSRNAQVLAPHIEAWEALELLTHLVEKSLVVYKEAEGEGRYRLLEMIQQYGRDRLLEAGEAEGVRRRHLEFFLRLAVEAEPQLRGSDPGPWLERLETDHDNLRAALEWCVAREEHAEAGLRLAGALQNFWHVHGHYREGRSWLERLLASSSGASPEARAKGLLGAGYLALMQGDHTRVAPFVDQSLALFRQLGDKRSAAQSLLHLAMADQSLGDFASSRALAEEGLALFREVMDRRGIATALHALGVMAWWIEGDYALARVLLEQSLTIRREMGDLQAAALSLAAVARVVRHLGDYPTARACLEESLTILQKMAYGYPRVLALCLDGFAALGATQGEMERAARLFGAAEALRETIQLPPQPNERADNDRSVATVRAALGETTFAAAWGEGRAMTPEQAAAFALADTSPEEAG